MCVAPLYGIRFEVVDRLTNRRSAADSFARVIRLVRVRQDAMATGTVDFFNDTGGYGFIDTEDSDDDVFFHMEDVGGPDLEEGQEVEFEIQDSPKGPRAANLTRL
jgi:CspA family cold shock protein